MGVKFFIRMAARNIKTNRKFYGPFILAAAITTAMFFMMISLLDNSFVQEEVTLKTMLQLGIWVIGIFSVIFLMYTNAVIRKTRQKEMGLYSILGLEKKHLTYLVFWENGLVASVSILLGLLTGLVLGYLNFLLINYLMQLSVPLAFSFSPISLLVTAGVFALIFCLLFLFNIGQILRAKPIHLLKNSQAGEGEPKASWLIFIFAIACLGAGYWISLTTESPISVIINLFVAVILVILGTYGLFTAATIVILKALKRNKGLYYKAGPFISISGMLYRMKAHAIGLANISILSTMVIVAVSTTISMYVGTENSLETRYPVDHSISIWPYSTETNDLTENLDLLNETVQAYTAETEQTISELIQYQEVNLMGHVKESQLVPSDIPYEATVSEIIFLPKDDFQTMSQQTINLSEEEIAIYTTDDDAKGLSQLTIFEQTFTVSYLEETPEQFNTMQTLSDEIVIVLPTMEAFNRILQEVQTENLPYNARGVVEFGLDEATSAEELAFAKGLGNHLETISVFANGNFYESRSLQREEWYIMNGGFLFLGIFLGMLFLIGTILITYFKQISEGLADRERIQIMQKVGLSREMTRKSTNSQVLWLFFLPIIVAVTHTAFAYPILSKLLTLFGIVNQTIIIASIAIVVLVFMLLYWLIYKATSKIYLRIVE